MTGKARVIAMLSDGLPHSHREGYALGLMLHSRVADLRRDGYEIECKRSHGSYWYRLIRKPLSAPQAAVSESTEQVALFDMKEKPAWA